MSDSEPEWATEDEIREQQRIILTETKELDESPTPDVVRQLVLNNPYYRRVFFTTATTQQAAMSIMDDIGLERHDFVTQYFLVYQGFGVYEFSTADEAPTTRRQMDSVEVTEGSAWVVQPGTWHNVSRINKQVPFKLLTIYFHPHHKRGTIHINKDDAMSRGEAMQE